MQFNQVDEAKYLFYLLLSFCELLFLISCFLYLFQFKLYALATIQSNFWLNLVELPPTRCSLLFLNYHRLDHSEINQSGKDTADDCTAG